MNRLIRFIPLAVLIFISSCGTPTSNAPSDPELLRISYQSEVTGAERDYFVYLPKGYEQKESWPVLLFLHGNGERGDAKDELDFARVHGPLYEAWVQKRDLPFVIINPQLPMYDQGEVSYIKNRTVKNIPQRLSTGVPERPTQFPSVSPMDGIPMDTIFRRNRDSNTTWSAFEDELIEMVKEVQSKYKGDPNRTYLSGISLGGFGTWYVASQNPDFFAAALPVVGWGHPELMGPIAEAKLPIWCIAGGRDQAVQIQYFYAGMNKLEQLGHKDFKFTIEADMNHDVWSRTYSGEDWYRWMLDRTKK